MKRKYIAAILTVFAMTTVCSTAFGATEHYTDSSAVGAESGWDEWVANWDATATDFTKVSLTPGKDDTELNFAWYSEKTDAAATPVVHFGTTKRLWIPSKERLEMLTRILPAIKLTNIIM